MENSLTELNNDLDDDDNYSRPEFHFKVAIALADDLMGAWTNRFSTDYQSKFNLQAFIKRRFCTPLFWISEGLNELLIATRTREYVYRSIYQTKNTKLTTLEEHIFQESFMTGKSSDALSMKGIASCRNYYEEHKQTVDYPTIFNFFYGEEAAKEFGYAPKCKCDEYLLNWR